MSTKSSQSSGESSPLLPTTFQQPTHIFSSEEEYTKGEEKSSKEESPFPEENEYLEENEYMKETEYVEENKYLEEEKHPQEDDYLKDKKYIEKDDYLEKEKYLEEDDYLEKKYQKGKEYLKERESLKEKKYLQKEKDYWYEEDYLEKELKVIHPSHIPPNLKERSPAAGVSQANTFLTITPPTFEPANKSPHSARKPSVAFKKDARRSLPWRNQSTQTESAYENLEPSTSKPKTEQEASTTLHTSKLDSEAMKSVPPDSFYDTILNEHPDILDGVDLKDSLFKSSYHSVFQTIIKEQAAHSELEEDTDIPLTGQLESKTRRKLRILLKTNVEKYKEVIHWIMEKRGNVYHIKDSDAVTHTFHLLSQSPPIEGSKIEEVKKTRHIHHKKKLDTEIDTEWIKSKAKVYQEDVKLILYPNENIFRILFSDESGQIYYPSGNLAVLFFCTQQSQCTYIILDDSDEAYVRALISNTGHATVYDENREIWLSLSQNLGYYFAKDKSQKAWNWWNLNLHVHAPPVQSISLDINQYIKVQVKSQDEVIFCFVHQTNRISLNLGTKYRFINPEKLREMKMKAILEVEFGSTARKIQVLLGKMSRILNFLTICDLETFIESTTNLLLGHSRRRRF